MPRDRALRKKSDRSQYSPIKQVVAARIKRGKCPGPSIAMRRALAQIQAANQRIQVQYPSIFQWKRSEENSLASSRHFTRSKARVVPSNKGDKCIQSDFSKSRVNRTPKS